MDTNGSEVQGARITLRDLGKPGKRVLTSGSNGEFTFSGLPAGEFKLTVTGPGWGRYVSPVIRLKPGDFQLLSKIVLPVSASAVVTVTANPAVLSEEQVHIAEQQRVLGIFPNFYSSYNWNAPPMQSKQKFQLALRSLTDPLTFVGAGAVAGIEDYGGQFPGYGSGAAGYAKRYAAAYADDWSGRMFSNAIYPSVFHQDPRYFYRGSGSLASRARWALAESVIARGDNGHWEPNYSHILGSFTAGAISNLYYPADSRGVSLVFANGAIDIAADAGANLAREFVLKRFTTRARERSGSGPTGH